MERRSALGPGTAYDPGNADHLLNVRLDSMSAFPDESAHLSEWLARQASGEFITRRTYGAHLRALLDKVVPDNPRRLGLVQGRRPRWTASMAGGRLRALIERVVLMPGDRRGEVHAALHGEFRAILDRLGVRYSNTPEVEASRVSVSMGAGAGFEPATFRL